MAFDTDVENNYFGRPKERGQYTISCFDQAGVESMIENHSMSLYNGTGTLAIELPDSVQAGHVLNLEVLIIDEQRIDPFVSCAQLTIVPFVDRSSTPGERRKPPSEKTGDDRLVPSGLSLPHVEWISREEWEAHDFDKFSALKVVQQDSNGNGDKQNYDFFINGDNLYLLNELKRAKGTEDLLKEQFKIGLVLVGLALIHESKDASDGQEIAERIAYASRALAMMLIPMINALGDLDEGDIVPITEAA